MFFLVYVFLEINTHLFPSNAQLLVAKAIVNDSIGALTPQLHDTSKETKEIIKKQWNHKHDQGGYLELR